MRILLIKPWAQHYQSNYAPLGLAYIAAVLEEAGHSVQILDLMAEGVKSNRFSSYLQKQKPDAIGISCVITEYNGILQVASLCKETSPLIPLIVGGPFPTSAPDIFLSQPVIDIVVISEGERTIVEVMERIEKGESMEGVPGTAYKQGGKQRFNPPREPILDLDAIPFPARHLLPMERYISSFENWFGKGPRTRATNIISTRGCPYSCIFCDRKVFGSKWRGRSASNIADEIQSLTQDYNINGIIFSDDMFDLYRRRVYQVCDEIDKRNLDIVWGVNSRVNHANEEMYRRIEHTGCSFIAFGIESGNQDVLDFMKKKIILKQAVDAVNMAKSVGIRTVGYFMMGMLGEDREKIRQTAQFAIGLKLDSGGFSRVAPVPNTALYDIAKGEGLIGEEDFVTSDLFGGAVNLIHDLDCKQIDRLVDQTYWQFFWSRPSRRLPKWICRFIGSLFPIIYTVVRGNLDFFLRLNRLREALHLRLP